MFQMEIRQSCWKLVRIDNYKQISSYNICNLVYIFSVSLLLEILSSWLVL